MHILLAFIIGNAAKFMCMLTQFYPEEITLVLIIVSALLICQLFKNNSIMASISGAIGFSLHNYLFDNFNILKSLYAPQYTLYSAFVGFIFYICGCLVVIAIRHTVNKAICWAKEAKLNVK